MKIRDMLFTEVGVPLVSKAEEWMDNIDGTVGGGGTNKNHSDCRFLTTVS